MGDLIGAAELARRMGVQHGQITAWRRRGCPSVGEGRARRYDLGAVREWAAANISTHKGGRPRSGGTGAPIALAIDVATVAAEPATWARVVASTSEQWSIIERALREATAAWAKAPTQATHTTMRQAQQQYEAMTQLLRQVQRDSVAIEKARGEVVSRAWHERVFAEIGTLLRDHGIRLPAEVAPRCVGKTAPQIQVVVEDAMRRYLDMIERYEPPAMEG